MIKFVDAAKPIHILSLCGPHNGDGQSCLMRNIVDLLYTATCAKKHDPALFVTYIVYVSQNFEYIIWKEGFKEQFVQLRIFIPGLYV